MVKIPEHKLILLPFISIISNLTKFISQMKNFSIITMSAAIISTAFFSCIPARQYEELKAKYETCSSERTTLSVANGKLETDINETRAKMEALLKEKDILVRDTATIGGALRKMQEQYDKINKLNDELLKKQAELQKGSEAENLKLMTELQKTQVELQKREDNLKNLERELENKRASLDQVSVELEKREQRVKELESLIAQKDSASNALKEKVSKALLGFKDKGLTITEKDGKIYVSLEAELLFAKGSTAIDQKGKEAIVALGKVLESQPDISIMVEGHTDIDKIIPGSNLKDNWDLSVLRATAVVRLLSENKNIEPKRLTAAGKGEYVPVDPDKTEAAKSKNRRIEVILTPDLDELFKILDSN